ncbi:MAG: hypothetical protein CME36_19780 [unclassified Hahellaceae]|nr:hypothetical protein [Hahellaceae bacterium]|tara:strand:+ start:32727 stop:33101 length:375 start_codon:yes stop_codon:yes gene_type:complete
MFDTDKTIKSLALQAVIRKLSPEQRNLFTQEFEAKRKNTGMTYFLWFIGFHYLYLNRVGIFFLYWLSCVLIIGLIWLIADAFRIPGMVQRRNEEIAEQILKNMIALNLVDADIALARPVEIVQA